MKRLILTIALASAAYGAYKLYKEVSPCYAAAKKWDEEYSKMSPITPGTVFCRWKHYSLQSGDDRFEFLSDTLITDAEPDWVTDGLDEIAIEADDLDHIGEQAKFAAKYVSRKMKLDAKTILEVKALGIAYFSKYDSLDETQLEQVKEALIYRLNNA